MPERANSLPPKSIPVAGIGALEVFFQDQHVIMGTWHNLSLVVWGAQASAPRVSEFVRLSDQLVRAHPEGVSSVHIILENIPLPPSDARAALNKLVTRVARQIACIATVLMGDGFATSAMRGFLTSLQFFQSRPFTPRIFATVPQAAAWVPQIHTPKTGVMITQSALSDVLKYMEGRITPFRNG